MDEGRNGGNGAPRRASALFVSAVIIAAALGVAVVVQTSAERVSDYLFTRAAAWALGVAPAGAPPSSVHLAIVIAPAAVPIPVPRPATEQPTPEPAPIATARLGRIWLSERYRFGDSRIVSVVAAGDVMMGSANPSAKGLNPAIRRDSDAGDLIGRDLAAIFRNADIAFVNLEGTLFDGTNTRAKSCGNCFAFRSPEYYSGILESLGVDVVSLANNHSGDFGAAGRAATLHALRGAGIAAAGLVSSARTASLTLRDGRKLGVIAFAPNTGTLNLNNIKAAQTMVRELAAANDLVLVSFHGGAEGWDATHVPDGAEIYLGENRGSVSLFAHRMVEAGASLVVGHGPHVPRALQIYRGHLIAYSLGNFWTYGTVINYAVSGLGPVIETWLAPDGTLAGLEIHSTRQAGLGVPQLDPLDEAARYVMYLTKSDYPSTEARLKASAQTGRRATQKSTRPSAPRL
jgi:hypothetical protein